MAERFAHLATRLFNAPLAIRPEKAEIIMAALAQRLGVADMVRLDGSVLALDDVNLTEGDDEAMIDQLHAYDVVGGVAIIPIYGTLVQKLGTLRPWSGMTGYDGIRQNFLVALADPAVDAIAFDVDSPGGEIAGCFDLADTIFAARGRKPIWSILSENAYSAAYALASSAARITVPRTGGTGSIGILGLHVDLSQALDKAGIRVTLIQYGAQKTDGADIKPLSNRARANLQRDIDAMGSMFDRLVARNRKLEPETVKGFEAATFMGRAGLNAGLADAVMAPDAAMASLLEQTRRNQFKRRRA